MRWNRAKAVRSRPYANIGTVAAANRSHGKTNMRMTHAVLALAPLVLLGSACNSTVTDGSRPSKPPNIVVILADDQGWGDLSLHGNTNLSTPHIDSLAHEGAMFEHFYVCSVCAPTRAEFLTGRYFARGGVRGVSTGQERLDIDEHTIAQTFRRAGYATGAFGKWHNGTQHPYHPNARGFDEFYGFTEGHWGHYFDYELDHNGQIVTGEGFLIDDVTNRALGFIEDNRDRPFFAYLPYNTPHSPMQVPDEYWERFESKELGMRHRDPDSEDVPKTRAALAMVENIDWNVGRVLAKLDELELSRNTIILYFSDNGPNSWRWNGGMKGRKGSVDEGGLRSPLVLRWTGRIPADRVIGEVAGAIDLLPTLADLAGIEVAASKPLDGRSLAPLVVGQEIEWQDRLLYSLRISRGRKQISVRNRQFRLDPQGQLFDIGADPGQREDVSDRFPEVADELRAAAKAWLDEVSPNVGPDDRPFPVGHSRLTLLPARDGVPHGGVQRSARAPNCSYFTNWTSTDDAITWDIEVAEAGEYEISVYYAAADAGATIEASFQGASVRGKVSEVHDPPAYGAEADRVPRVGESLVKDFHPLSLGTASLPKARGELTLKAVALGGKQVAEIRYATLRRL